MEEWKSLLDDRNSGRGVHGRILDRIPVFSPHPMLNSVKHVVHYRPWRESRRRTHLKYASSDQDGVPSVLGLLAELIRAPNVRLGSVANKIHSVQRRINAVRVPAPLLQKPGRELERSDLRFAECGRLQLISRDGLEHGFEADAQSAHADSREVMGRAPNDVVVREEDRRSFFKAF